MNTAEKVAKIIAENKGKRLFDIGFIEIPKD
jgi:flavodoxin